MILFGSLLNFPALISSISQIISSSIIRKGLSLYSQDKSQFLHFPFDNGKAYNNQILSISEMIDNQLWLGTEKGLVNWDQQTENI